MADDAAPLMHVDWLRTFEAWRQELQTPIEINVEQIIGGGQPLTRVNDTNVTLTLTGTPLTALLKPVTATLGWVGTLAAARLNANVVQSITNDTNVTGVIAAQNLTLGWTGTLGVARGGTNLASYAVGDLLYASGATTLSKLADVAVGSYLRSGGVTTAPLWSTLTLPNAAATGDLVYASSANTMVVRTIGNSNDVLTVSGGVPTWAASSPVATNVMIANDIATNASVFPTWVTANTGNLPIKVSSTKLFFNPSTGNLDVVGAVLQLTATVTPEIRINLDTGTASVSTLGFYEGAIQKATIQYAGSAVTTAARRGELGFSATRIVYGTNRTVMDGDSSLVSNRSLSIGKATNTLTGIELIANSTSWFLDHRGNASVTNNRFMLGTESVSDIFVALRTGQIGIGTGSPTAYLHLKAGTTAASTAPLKFVSGNLQTTAEAGAVEFLTDAFYGTITTGAARKTFAFLEAPSLTTWSSSGKLTNYNGIATAGWGLGAIYGSGRSTAQVAAVASVAAYTLTAADGSFRVSANVNVTTSTTHNFTVAVDYTDETNTAQTLTLTFSQLAGVFVTAITNVTGAGPYEGIPLHIRCKASTAITVKTVGTFTVVTYNVEGTIQQVA